MSVCKYPEFLPIAKNYLVVVTQKLYKYTECAVIGRLLYLRLNNIICTLNSAVDIVLTLYLYIYMLLVLSNYTNLTTLCQ